MNSYAEKKNLVNKILIYYGNLYFGGTDEKIATESLKSTDGKS